MITETRLKMAGSTAANGLTPDRNYLTRLRAACAPSFVAAYLYLRDEILPKIHPNGGGWMVALPTHNDMMCNWVRVTNKTQGSCACIPVELIEDAAHSFGLESIRRHLDG